jgi:hypothetical protein
MKIYVGYEFYGFGEGHSMPQVAFSKEQDAVEWINEDAWRDYVMLEVNRSET